MLRAGVLVALVAVSCHPSALPSAQPAAPAPHLVVKLEPGWRLAADTGLLASADGRSFDPLPDLPAGTRISPRVPELAAAHEGSLTPDEAELARYLQIVFPGGLEPASYLPAVRAWPGVEAAELSPEVSLP